MSSKKVKKKETTIGPRGEIRRIWGDLPVADATFNMPIFVLEEDVRGASKKDPQHCVFARACRRAFHSEHVLFWRTVAYLDLPGTDGKRTVFRFNLSDEARKTIADFDMNKPVLPEQGVMLCAPLPSVTLGKKDEYRRRYAEKTRRAIINGEYKPEKSPQKAPRKLLELADVRLGTGRVQFRRKR